MKNKLGIIFKEITKHKVVLSRITLESRIDFLVEEGSTRRDLKIKTDNKFFNHMLTGIASRSCLNIDVTYTQTNAETLDHVIVEDTGLTFGRAIRELLDKRQEDGVMQRGTYTVAFDEALVCVTLAFDGRAYCFLNGDVPGVQLPFAEDILTTNIKQFFEGFAQGAGCVVNVQFLSGTDS
ncbi:MAG: hypothetical protein KGJ07_09190, partial [Patescibacteria group bacterium]|nr:hypothetical protein [Patescibacteria group bacterium]